MASCIAPPFCCGRWIETLARARSAHAAFTNPHVRQQQRFVIITVAAITLIAMTVPYFGTLKIAKRLLPKFIVWRRVPTKTRLRPLTAANLHRVPLVIRSPLFGFLPFIVILGAICFP